MVTVWCKFDFILLSMKETDIKTLIFLENVIYLQSLNEYVHLKFVFLIGVGSDYAIFSSTS